MNKPLPAGSLDNIGYVCIETMYEGQWTLSFHSRRKSWEVPGGHVEPGEDALVAARRELFEETGALDYDITPVWDYRAITADGVFHNNGRVYFARVREFGPLPECSEMERIGHFAALPEDVTYDRDSMTEMLELAAKVASGEVCIQGDDAPERVTYMKSHELEKVSRFFAQRDENGVSNANKIPGGFDPMRPERCEGLIFDGSGRFVGMGIHIQNESVYPIEKFKLYYQGLNLTGDADMSGCSDMVYFYLYHNKLTRANVRGMTALRVLGLQGNELTELDVSELPVVQGIDVGKNRIAALDVSHNPELVEYYVHVNELTEMDISRNPKLKYVWCFKNHITHLDATHNPLLKHMDCTDNPLVEYHGFAPDWNGTRPLNVTAGEGGYIGVKYCPVYDAKWKETGEWHQLLYAYPAEGRRFVRWEDASGAELSTQAVWEMAYGASVEAKAVFE